MSCQGLATLLCPAWVSVSSDFCSRKFSLKTVLLLADQMVSPPTPPSGRGPLGTQLEDAGAGSSDSDLGLGPGDLDHQPWLGVGINI